MLKELLLLLLLLNRQQKGERSKKSFRNISIRELAEHEKEVEMTIFKDIRRHINFAQNNLSIFIEWITQEKNPLGLAGWSLIKCFVWQEKKPFLQNKIWKEIAKSFIIQSWKFVLSFEGLVMSFKFF